ncbi:3-keto-disaccharide hydrolase [Urbifossiella limnaea]|uniref:3-keto-alpha-glucoside-1,2-lyase/3-keto-2-hydroxy-glucal hydratase domain-containing protein n=1 Tax=Urbifossiella limnaea TaxID=2528023 RepID=A0A517XYX0_9BACT|nr:DUF1080 domain-containing protein [Urbifossiella limnaea]QDU22673.1 hypothetical protein ETAA1_46560 [Urbifossiella limnaea]
MRTFLAVAFTSALATLAAGQPAAPVPLFNGKDLTGWKAFGRLVKDGPTTPIDAKDTWSVTDGVLRCTGKPTGYLATEAEYGDYELTLRWRYPAGLKGGNSGVLLHVQKADVVWPVSVEAQLRAGRAGDIWLQTAAEVKLTVDPARRDADDKTKRHVWRSPKDEVVERPAGEWNDYRIACRGGSVELAVNGRVVNGGTDCNLTRGRIALQSEGTDVEFKDITIRPLK